MTGQPFGWRLGEDIPSPFRPGSHRPRLAKRMRQAYSFPSSPLYRSG